MMRFLAVLYLAMQLYTRSKSASKLTYIVDVDADRRAGDSVDQLVILEVLAVHLARHHVVLDDLKKKI
jgi:hypothetical protein